ncbi:MAG: NAD(P)H-dependent oxidoreductase [Leptolyngbyaceae cyanobacterium]
MTPDQILERLNWRYATKKFDPSRKISDDVWHALEQSLVLAPSSFGQQPWKFFVIRNPEVRKQLQEQAWGQSQVVDASHFVVLAIKTGINNEDVDRYIDRVAEVRQTPKDSLEGLENAIKGFLKDHSFAQQINAWAAKQVYIALGFFLYSAALLDIDACPMEGFMPDKVDEVLGLPAQGYSAVVLCAAGYRSEEDKLASAAKVRYETEAVVQYVD